MYYYLDKDNGALLDSFSKRFGDSLQQLTKLEYDIFQLICKNGGIEVSVTVNKMQTLYNSYSDNWMN